jgi:hypothetical protein
MSTKEARVVADHPERLCWTEVCKRYPDAWVVVTDIVWAEEGDCDFASALVLGHYARRKEASPHIKAAFEHHDEVGSFWTGEIRGPIPRFIP